MPYIAMIGDPYVGFEVFGPCASVEAADDAGKWARNKYGDLLGNDWWTFKLNALLDEPIEEVDPAGAAVVFAGNIFAGSINIFGSRGAWSFFGPFKDLSAATKWAWEEGPGADYAIELRPVEPFTRRQVVA